MNLIDGVVTKVIGDPFKMFNHWWIKVSYNDMGGEGVTQFMFKTFE